AEPDPVRESALVTAPGSPGRAAAAHQPVQPRPGSSDSSVNDQSLRDDHDLTVPPLHTFAQGEQPPYERQKVPSRWQSIMPGPGGAGGGSTTGGGGAGMLPGPEAVRGQWQQCVV